uniref:transketolase n=1 Tax=Vitrella brassicaformis TaxID=1169539 RepID=A0A7S1KC05_9ALVE
MPFKANSGHPGAPMGCAPMAHALWGSIMNYAPKHPDWINRDRFVLSNGHGCALQYAMLHLAGYDLSIDDLKQFRQLHSKTPGHPESFVTPGVEVCTGPLGQGISNAVGMAIGAHHLAEKYNKKDLEIFDSYVYAICGDGCLMEGVSSEACSLAGHLGLGRLIVLYDDNKISIDGDTALAFTEEVNQRFKAYGWQTLEVKQGDVDFTKIVDAVLKGKKNTGQPTLIKVTTTIGYGSVKEGTESVHGAPLKAEDMKQLREKFGFDPEKTFHVEEDVLEFYRGKCEEGEKKYEEWQALFNKYSQQYPEEAKEITRRFEGRLPDNWKSLMPKYTPNDAPAATRNLSHTSLNAVHSFLPELIGGSADLEESNKSGLKGEGNFATGEHGNKYIRFGVREHGMSAIVNGLFAYGGFRPFCATFLNFVTYGWGAVRLTALSRFGVLYIATHDSIELGEDGPTHQPIETIPLIRATPNMLMLRPADGNETSGSYAVWLENRTRPSVMALCRGAVPQLEGSSFDKVAQGAYVLQDWSAGNTGKRALLAGCGSELHLAVEAKKLLMDKGVSVRIVSMPCWDLFREQSAEYQKSVIPAADPNLARVYFEPAFPLGWERYFDDWVGMETFGASAPKKDTWAEFGFSAPHIANLALKKLDLPTVPEPMVTSHA